MNRSTTIRKTLAEIAIGAASRSGLDGVSLRNIAKEAGCSTAAIFQNFDGKAELIGEAVELAAKHDTAFHDRLLIEADGLITNHVAFSDFLCAYIDARVAVPQTRFLSEALLKLSDEDRCRTVLKRWHKKRQSFWKDILAPFSFAERLGPLVAEYSLMEEVYAYPIREQPRFQLLKREAVRSLTDACFHEGSSSGPGNEINRILKGQSFEQRALADRERSGMSDQLLRHAVRIVKHDGIAALNQRNLAQQANVSSSMIAYHYKDMKTLTSEAVWCALMEELPSEFIPGRMAKLPQTRSEWIDFLETLAAPSPDSSVDFYVSYSRLTCEAGLLACSDRPLAPLITYLREIDGWGTYRLSRNIPSLADHVQREHAAAFAIWLKAEALLRSSGLVAIKDGQKRIENAMALIFPSKP